MENQQSTATNRPRDNAATRLPHPPFELATRVGSLEGVSDPWTLYEVIGRSSAIDLHAALPDGFSLDGCRVLDFGCGAGRTLRHFIGAGAPCEFWGCDIDAASVAWLEKELSPPIHAFQNQELPPLDLPDEMFDLIYCVSVFSHLSRSWSAWLLELHRVLKPNGVLLATFIGEGESERFAGKKWDESSIGMLPLGLGRPWDNGGPTIIHSPWWIREHWGRLFSIVALRPHGFPGVAPATGQGIVTMRKKDVDLNPADLERPSDDPREAASLAHAVDCLMRENESLREASGR